MRIKACLRLTPDVYRDDNVIVNSADSITIGPDVCKLKQEAARPIPPAPLRRTYSYSRRNLRCRLRSSITRGCTRPRADRDPIYLSKHGFNSGEYRDGRCFCTMRAPRRTRVRREERTDAPAEESSEKYARPWVTVINHPRSYSGDLFRFLLARRRSTGVSPRSRTGRGRGRGG